MGPLLLGLTALLASACSNTMIDQNQPYGTTVPQDQRDRAVVLQYPGEISLGPLPEKPVAADPEAAPVPLAMINQENVDLGSFPEVREGAEAAVEFINTELGGVDGRPIELTPCLANFTPERSQACAQMAVEDRALAVVGGLDIMSTASIPVLEAGGVPYIGGIPVNTDEMRSPLSFQFSGGSPGAFTAFADHIAREIGTDAKVTVGYADYAPIKAAALEFGVKTLAHLGVTDVAQVAFPIVTNDYAPVVARAFADDPDAVIMSVTDKACVHVMEQAARYRGQLYLVGACAAPGTTRAAGDAAEGVIFNVEGPIDPAKAGPDVKVYAAAMARYAPDTAAQSAATVAFRAVMNLWDAMRQIGADDLTSQTLLDHLGAAVDQPSFTGHRYTCDGQQVPGLRSLCSPQQVLVRHDGERLRQITDWIDVPALAQAVAAG